MFDCGKHGLQTIVATENFMDGTVHTLGCRCRGTIDALREGWPPVPVPGPITSEDLAAFVGSLPIERLAELRTLLPPEAVTVHEDLAQLDQALAPAEVGSKLPSVASATATDVTPAAAPEVADA